MTDDSFVPRRELINKNFNNSNKKQQFTCKEKERKRKSMSLIFDMCLCKSVYVIIYSFLLLLNKLCVNYVNQSLINDIK